MDHFTKHQLDALMKSEAESYKLRNAFTAFDTSHASRAALDVLTATRRNATQEMIDQATINALRRNPAQHAIDQIMLRRNPAQDIIDHLAAVRLDTAHSLINQLSSVVRRDAAQSVIDQLTAVRRETAHALIDQFTASQRFSTKAMLNEIQKSIAFSERSALEAVKNLTALESHRLFANAERSALEAVKNLAIREREQLSANFYARQSAALTTAIRTASESVKFEALYNTLSRFDHLNSLQLASIPGSAKLAALSIRVTELESVFSSQSFANTVADAVRSALSAHKFDASAFEGVEELIDEKLATLPQDKVATFGVYEIIRDIIFAILALSQSGLQAYQIYDARQIASEQDQKQIVITAQQDERWAHALEFLEQIAKNTAGRVPENDPSKYYLVEREVVLRVKPTTKAAKIVVLFPNQRVALVKENHKWIYIEYFDYIEGVPRYGWAMKKYLQRMD